MSKLTQSKELTNNHIQCYDFSVGSQPSEVFATEDEMATKEELINKKIGKTIARKRKIAGFTQEEVAEHLGIGSEAFSRIERGLISPGIFKLYEMADMFECGIETFLVEGSRRPTDQAEYLSRMLASLSISDRSFVMGNIERMVKHLGRKRTKETDKEEDENSKESRTRLF